MSEISLAYNRSDMLRSVDKDLICQFVYASSSRCLAKKFWGNNPVPQGVSVFLRHRDGRIEYLFTKDDRLMLKQDDRAKVREHVRAHTPDEEGIVYYMHSQMIPIASKHFKEG